MIMKPPIVAKPVKPPIQDMPIRVIAEHDIKGVADGRQVVTTAGERVHLTPIHLHAKFVIITAETDNTSVVVVGGDQVQATLATRRGIPLYAGESTTLLVDDLYDIYLDALVSTEGVTWLCMGSGISKRS